MSAAKYTSEDDYIPQAEAVPVQVQSSQYVPTTYGANQNAGQQYMYQQGGLEAGLLPQQQQQLADVEMIIRHGFVRKVMGILTVQLLVTFGIVAAFLFTGCPNVWYPEGAGLPSTDAFPNTSTKLGTACKEMWHKDKATGLTCTPVLHGNDRLGCRVQSNYGPYVGSAFAAWFVSIFLICGMMAKARKYPTNYVLLGVFTLCWGYFLAVVCVFKSAQVVGLAVAITVALTALLMLFACQTRYDFTGHGPYLYMALWWMLIMGWMFWWVAPVGYYNWGYVNMAYCAIGVLIFSMYVVYDTQLIVGGKHKKFQFSVDDYVWGALALYLDIINLFLYILALLGNNR